MKQKEVPEMDDVAEIISKIWFIVKYHIQEQYLEDVYICQNLLRALEI